jgi:hypothetical protein
MNDAITECIDRFVHDVLQLAERACAEQLAVLTPQPTERPPKRRTTGTSAMAGSNGGTPGTTVMKNGDATMPSEAEDSMAPTPAEEARRGREALVLDTVRALLRATAGEIAARAGQPNGSTYVTLRALVGRGLVARTETSRGVEYGLVSTGEVRPFKRNRSGSTTAARSESAPR